MIIANAQIKEIVQNAVGPKMDFTAIYLTLTGIIFASLILVRAADYVISSIKNISRSTGVATFTVAALLVALATSLPEAFVGITSALNDTPALSLGNIMGANIANLSIVLGLAGLFGGVVIIKSDSLLHKDLPLALFAGLTPIILLWDKQLSTVDGLILLTIYLAYATGFFRGKLQKAKQSHEQESFWYRVIRKIETGEGGLRKEVVKFFVALVVLLIAADVIVRLSSALATSLNIPIFLVGLIIVSLGTTLPEIVFSYRALRSDAPMLLLGNTLGSVIANSTLILGIVALIRPIEIAARKEYLMATSVFAFVLLLFWLFVGTKHKLARWEASVLGLIYIIFVIVQMSGFRPF